MVAGGVGCGGGWIVRGAGSVVKIEGESGGVPLSVIDSRAEGGLEDGGTAPSASVVNRIQVNSNMGGATGRLAILSLQVIPQKS